jgi:hypothetical protein
MRGVVGRQAVEHGRVRYPRASERKGRPVGVRRIGGFGQPLPSLRAEGEAIHPAGRTP